MHIYMLLRTHLSPHTTRYLDRFSRFLHSSRHRVPILYTGPPLPLSKFPIRRGSFWTASNRPAWFLRPTRGPQLKRHLDRFSRFCRVHDRDRQTDTRTDRPRCTPSV